MYIIVVCHMAVQEETEFLLYYTIVNQPNAQYGRADLSVTDCAGY